MNSTTATKPKIYLYCIKQGPSALSRYGENVMGFALAEDGTGIASHYSSNVGFSKHDMGLTSTSKHHYYSRHYPEGYELEWVDEDQIEKHLGLQGALSLNRAASRPEAAGSVLEVTESDNAMGASTPNSSAPPPSEEQQT